MYLPLSASLVACLVLADPPSSLLGTDRSWHDSETEDTAADTSGPDPPLSWSEAAAGTGACGLLEGSGEIRCWGADLEPPSGAFHAIDGGGDWLVSYFCALDAGDVPQCWRSQAKTSSQTGPPATPVLQLSVGDLAACARMTDTSARCWGSGLLADETPPPGGFDLLAVGTDTACGLREDGGVECWGRGHSTLTLTGEAITSLAMGASWLCVLGASGGVQCIDLNGTLAEIEDVPGGAWAALSAGQGHACVLSAAGDARCWGSEDEGQLAVPGLRFDDLDAGGDATCGVDQDAALSCWGDTHGAPPR